MFLVPVKDITWRTTRIESDDGHMISLANRKVTEAFMENFSNVPNGISIETHFYTSMNINPDLIIPIITSVLNQICDEFSGDSAKVTYKGTINMNGDWVSDFRSFISYTYYCKQIICQRKIFIDCSSEFSCE
jgi:small-conductance mechanosensitive channel